MRERHPLIFRADNIAEVGGRSLGQSRAGYGTSNHYETKRYRFHESNSHGAMK